MPPATSAARVFAACSAVSKATVASGLTSVPSAKISSTPLAPLGREAKRSGNSVKLHTAHGMNLISAPASSSSSRFASSATSSVVSVSSESTLAKMPRGLALGTVPPLNRGFGALSAARGLPAKLEAAPMALEAPASLRPLWPDRVSLSAPLLPFLRSARRCFSSWCACFMWAASTIRPTSTADTSIACVTLTSSTVLAISVNECAALGATCSSAGPPPARPPPAGLPPAGPPPAAPPPFAAAAAWPPSVGAVPSQEPVTCHGSTTGSQWPLCSLKCDASSMIDTEALPLVSATAIPSPSSSSSSLPMSSFSAIALRSRARTCWRPTLYSGISASSSSSMKSSQMPSSQKTSTLIDGIDTVGATTFAAIVAARVRARARLIGTTLGSSRMWMPPSAPPSYPGRTGAGESELPSSESPGVPARPLPGGGEEGCLRAGRKLTGELETSDEGEPALAIAASPETRSALAWPPPPPPAKLTPPPPAAIDEEPPPEPLHLAASGGGGVSRGTTSSMSDVRKTTSCTATDAATREMASCTRSCLPLDPAALPAPLLPALMPRVRACARAVAAASWPKPGGPCVNLLLPDPEPAWCVAAAAAAAASTDSSETSSRLRKGALLLLLVLVPVPVPEEYTSRVDITEGDSRAPAASRSSRMCTRRSTPS